MGRTGLPRVIKNARAIAVILSSGASETARIRQEIITVADNAREGRTLLIPVLLNELSVSQLPGSLEQFHGVRVDAQHGIDKAARQIALALARSRPQATDSSIQTVVAELERSLADSERILGADHPSTLTVRANLAGLYQQTGRSDAAIALLERSLADSERILGADHPSTLTVRANLAGLYQQTGRSEAAVTMLQQSLADSERILGPKHPTTLAVRANLEYVLSTGLSKAARDV